MIRPVNGHLKRLAWCLAQIAVILNNSESRGPLTVDEVSELVELIGRELDAAMDGG